MDQCKDKYWVIGGLYISTDFEILHPGTELEEYGPFDTKEEAKEEWRARSWKRVDECECRYEIKLEMDLECSQSEKELVEIAAASRGLSLDEFVNLAIVEYMENHPFTREDFMEISE